MRISIEAKPFENKERTARKELENFRTRNKPLEETREFENKEQTARKELEDFRTSSKPLERDSKNSKVRLAI